jgi:hypothetical protein
MKKIIRLTESELVDVVKQIVEYTNIPNVQDGTIVRNIYQKPNLYNNNNG